MMHPRYFLAGLGAMAFYAFLLLGLTGCLEDECTRSTTFTRWDPVYRSLEEIRQDIAMEPARDLENPGKIYYYNGYLLINERMEGIHIIDNADPESPVNLGFIRIPGNVDMAVKDDILYADMYRDLLAIDISNPLDARVVSTEEDVFVAFIPFVEGRGYLVEYTPTTITTTVDCNDDNWGAPWFVRGEALFMDVSLATTNAFAGGQTAIPSSVGTGGSMARFTIAKSHLYTLDQWIMHTFDITTPEPVLQSSINISWDIETIFPTRDALFIGSRSGMFIYSIEDPANPAFLSQFSHATACDPVFVQGETAFVTLRDGVPCQTNNNELDIIDISDLRKPQLVEVYPMEHPHGLSVVNDILFLCEGSHGLKVFHVADLSSIAGNMLDHVKDVDSYDVIVLPPGDLVMLIGQDGFYQYDASDPADLQALSYIPVLR